MRFVFEDYAFDTDRRELRRGAEIVSVTPQAFDLLDYLIRNRERVVSKDDLIDAIWNGRSVSDAALTTRLNAARSAVGDSGHQQRLIKTLPRKGFRFVGHVLEAPAVATVFGKAGEPPKSAAVLRNDPPMVREPDRNPVGDHAATKGAGRRLSIVVLPFTNLGGGLEQDYFIDGITDSLTTDLSRISGAFVIARNTAFTFKGKAVDVQQLGRELNVSYVLEGSVQRGANRLRINVQLIDAETRAHLWADRFEKPVADLFEMQDEIVSRLAATLDAQLTVAEAQRAEHSPHPDAMGLFFQGRAAVLKGPAQKNLIEARGFFQRALDLDPRSVGALVGLAYVDVTIGTDLLTDNRAALLSAAEASAVKALSLAPNYATAHLMLGYVYIFTNRAARGIAECDQALVLNANLAGAHAAIGLAKMYMGHAAETESHILEAFRLSPRDIAAYWWMYCVGMAKLELGADAEAADWLRRSIGVNRTYPIAHFALAAALGLLGVLDEAQTSAKTGLSLNPGFTVHRLRDARSSHHPTYLAWRERLYEGLRLAGVPEG